VDFFTHALSQRLVNHLMLLHPTLATEGRAHNDGLEMLTVSSDLHMVAVEALLDVCLNLVWGKQLEITDQEV
jgi:hypothetical protein